MESSFQLMIAYDMFHYVKFTALSIKTICRALPLSVDRGGSDELSFNSVLHKNYNS